MGQTIGRDEGKACRRIQAHARIAQNDTQRPLGATITHRDWRYLSETIEKAW